MKSKVWRSGNSLVITIPSEIVEKLNLMERRLVDFDIKDVFEETEKIFDNMFGNVKNIISSVKESNSILRQPLTDLRETEKEFIVLLELPGVNKKEILLNIGDNHLEVKVEKRSEMKISDEKKGLLRSERIYNGFYRTMNLPSNIMPEKARASYNNGILEIILPKLQRNKLDSRKISIE